MWIVRLWIVDRPGVGAPGATVLLGSWIVAWVPTETLALQIASTFEDRPMLGGYGLARAYPWP